MITGVAAMVSACAGCIGGVVGGLVVLAFTSRTRQADAKPERITLRNRSRS